MPKRIKSKKTKMVKLRWLIEERIKRKRLRNLGQVFTVILLQKMKLKSQRTKDNSNKKVSRKNLILPMR